MIIKNFNAEEIKNEFKLTNKEITLLEIASITNSIRIKRFKRLRHIFKIIKKRSNEIDKRAIEDIKNVKVRKFLNKKERKRGGRKKCRIRNRKIKYKIW